MSSVEPDKSDLAIDDAGEEHHHDDVRSSGAPDIAFEKAARMFRAVGDEGRLRLLELLSQGESCVTELASATGDSLSTVSQRLRVLRTEDLVVRRREGKHIFYALADQHVTDLVLTALEHALE